MVSALRAWFIRVTSQTLPAERAALLRIAVASVWLAELVALRSWQADLYDLGLPLQGVIFDVWIMATVALFVGFHARVAAGVAFACSILFVQVGREIYHVDYLAQLATFYLAFTDASATWSVDALRTQRTLSPRGRRIAGFPVVAMLIHVSFIYLDAGLSHLFLNRLWASGELVRLSLAHPQWASSFGPVLIPFSRRR